MKRWIAVGVLALVAGLPGCPGIATPGPAPSTAGTGAEPDAAAVCARLAYLECPEGLASHCEATVRKVMAADLIELDRRCILSAPDRSSVRRCAGIRCEVP